MCSDVTVSTAATGREYPSRPLVGVGVVVLKPEAVLLVSRGRPPAIGQWSLPGGAQKLGETAEAAARRELQEETGLRVGPLRLVGHVDSIHLDDFNRVRYHYTILDFVTVWRGGQITPGGDVTSGSFVPLNRLDAYDLWGPARRIIDQAVAMFG